MTEVEIGYVTALRCPNCKQILKEADYPKDVDVDYCVYCDVKFFNGFQPEDAVSHMQPTYRQVDYQAKISRRSGSPATIDSLQMNAQTLVMRNVEALGLGYNLDSLSKREFEKWKLGFKRTFDRPQIIDNFLKHPLDLLLGAMIAKKQFNMEFDGSEPYNGRYGYSVIMPHHMGRKGWGVDKRQKHIDIKVHDKMVCVITGYMDSSSSGTIKQLRSVLDGKKKPWKYTQPSFASGEILDVDESYILRNNTSYELVFKPALGMSSLQPIGIAYLPERLMVDPKIGEKYGMVTNLRQPLKVTSPSSDLLKRDRLKRKKEDLYRAYVGKAKGVRKHLTSTVMPDFIRGYADGQL